MKKGKETLFNHGFISVSIITHFIGFDYHKNFFFIYISGKKSVFVVVKTDEMGYNIIRGT